MHPQHTRTAVSLVTLAIVLFAPVAEGTLQQKCTDSTLSLLRIELYDTGYLVGDYWDLDAKVRGDGSQPGISAFLSHEPYFVLTAKGMRGSDWERRSITWTDQVRAALENEMGSILSESYFLVRFRGQILFGGRAVHGMYPGVFIDEPMLYVDMFSVEDSVRIRVEGLDGIARYSEYIDSEMSGYLEQMRQCQDR